ncbi:hypothetical protein LG314_05215 [Agrococcus terreus]|uniref:hypothetical protein n=1 Tax=Agrococcus terreus TaxID=574649 RepID=UPI00384BE94C
MSDPHLQGRGRRALDGSVVPFAVALGCAVVTAATFAAQEDAATPLRGALFVLGWALWVPLTAGMLGWASWAFAQGRRLAHLRSANPSSLVMPAYSSDMLLFAALERGDAMHEGWRCGALMVRVSTVEAQVERLTRVVLR